MDGIGGIGTSGGLLPTSLTKKAKGMGKEDFLTMLIAQLKNQDPLNPMNGTDFAVQLAQFSSLEQLYNVNSQLDSLGGTLTSLTNAQLTGMIGAEASAKGDTLTVAGPSTKGAYRLSGDAQKVAITIYDGQGMPVKTLNAEGGKAGMNSFTWDTANVPNGNYTFAVAAVDGSGNPVAAETTLTGIVQGVTTKEGISYLTINGQNVAYGDVFSVTKPSI